jgi:hypothetical protein
MGRIPLGGNASANSLLSCRNRPIPVDCLSFAPKKRHLALFAMANLLSRRAGLAAGCHVEQYAAGPICVCPTLS